MASLAMHAPQDTLPEPLSTGRGLAALYVLPAPQHEAPGFCALVGRALRSHRCVLSMCRPDGTAAVYDAVQPVLEFTRLAPDPNFHVNVDSSAGSSQRRYGRLDGAGEIEVNMSTTVMLADGTTALLTVADPVDGRPYDQVDRALFEHLASSYAATAATHREVVSSPIDLQDARRQTVNATETERQRLARELHDDLGHTLTTTILSIDMTAQRVRANSPAREALTAARQALTECATNLHDFAFHLRPRVLNDLGLTPALRGLARRVSQMGGVEATVTAHGSERRIGDDAELAAFRIAQEALTNALKHAGANQVTIDIMFGDAHIDLEIRDDGTGMDMESAKTHGHRQGLRGMQERAELVGGTLELQSRPGCGTTVWARLPVGGDGHE